MEPCGPSDDYFGRLRPPTISAHPAHDLGPGARLRRRHRHDGPVRLGPAPLRPRGASRTARLCRGRHRAAGQGVSGLQQRHCDHRGERARGQRRRGPIRRDREGCAYAWPLPCHHHASARRPGWVGDSALGLPQECRGARHADACRLSARAPDGYVALFAADADVVRRSAWRHHHSRRHLAQHHRFKPARRPSWRTLRHV